MTETRGSVLSPLCTPSLRFAKYPAMKGDHNLSIVAWSREMVALPAMLAQLVVEVSMNERFTFEFALISSNL